MYKAVPLVGVKAGKDDGLGDGVFEGYASVFGVKDSYGDVVQPGAFTDTLKEWAESGNTIPIYWSHDMGSPMSNIGAVTEAVEDERGLKITGQLDTDEATGMKVFKLLKGRRVSQMSFAYEILEGGPAKSEDHGDYYSLDRLKLYEVSVVQIGANQATEILAVKHLAEAVKAGRALSSKNETALRDARDAIDSVLSSIADDDTKAAETGGSDQEKASDAAAADSSGASDSESSAPSERPKSGPSARILAAHTQLTLSERN